MKNELKKEKHLNMPWALCWLFLKRQSCEHAKHWYGTQGWHLPLIGMRSESGIQVWWGATNLPGKHNWLLATAWIFAGGRVSVCLADALLYYTNSIMSQHNVQSTNKSISRKCMQMNACKQMPVSSYCLGQNEYSKTKRLQCLLSIYSVLQSRNGGIMNI